MVLIVAIVLVLGAAVASYFLFFKEQPENNVSSNNDGITYAPATDEERSDAEKHKQDLSDQQDAKSSTSSQNQSPNASVTITSATSDAVYAYVSGVVEDGGTCTATFTKNSATFQKTSKGFTNVNTTQCEPIFLSSSDFSSTGDWQVTISYSSSAAKGTSQVSTITIR